MRQRTSRWGLLRPVATLAVLGVVLGGCGGYGGYAGPPRYGGYYGGGPGYYGSPYYGGYGYGGYNRFGPRGYHGGAPSQPRVQNWSQQRLQQHWLEQARRAR